MAWRVGIERHRLAIALQIGSRGPEVVEGRLCRHEARMHDPACGVIHEGEEGALRSPILEPPVLGAINLDQLPHARAGLVAPRQTLLAILSDSFRPHPLSERLDAKPPIMALGQFL